MTAEKVFVDYTLAGLANQFARWRDIEEGVKAYDIDIRISGKIGGELTANVEYNCKPDPKELLTDEEYLGEDGSICPSCRSSHINGGPVEIDGAGAYQNISCDECGFEWQDNYKLVGYEVQ